MNFQALAEGENIHDKWERCKKAITTTCDTVLGHRDPRRKDWITDATWEEVEPGETLNRNSTERQTTKRRKPSDESTNKRTEW